MSDQNLIAVQVQVSGETDTVEVPEGSTARTIYNYITEQTGAALSAVRVLVNNVTVEPLDAENVVLQPGDLVDVIPEVTNG